MIRSLTLVNRLSGVCFCNNPCAYAHGSNSKNNLMGQVFTQTLTLVLAVCTLVAVSPGQSRRKDAPHATLAGTVFRDPGFAQPGALVVVSLKSAPDKPIQKLMTDRRGDFAFRVPPGPASYYLTATLKGFKRARDSFDISGEEQINATLLLIPESKK